jgi:hypothetical protein
MREREREITVTLSYLSLVEENQISLSLWFCILFYARAFGKSARTKKTQNMQHKPLSLSLSPKVHETREEHNARRRGKKERRMKKCALAFLRCLLSNVKTLNENPKQEKAKIDALVSTSEKNKQR